MATRAACDGEKRSGVEKSINWLVRVALTGVRVSDSVEERITSAKIFTSSGWELSLGTAQADYHADDGLRDERPPGGRDEGRNPQYKSGSDGGGYYA